MATIGRAGTARPYRGRKTGPARGATVPIFVLIPFQRLRGSLAIQPLVDRAQGELAGEFLGSAGRK